MTHRIEQGSKVRIGCVSFLNARPLIDGLDAHPELDVRYDVPARLLEDLLAGEVDIALCPVVDYQTSPEPLAIVPVGGIGSQGATLTVRLLSKVPFTQIRQLHADPDSHTSVVLASLLLRDLYGVTPSLVDLVPAAIGAADTLLLIGDKVVRGAPSQALYPHQLDLGLAWQERTGLPFVFAVWMCRRGAELGRAAELLDRQRRINASRIDAIVAAHAADAGFPPDLARRYLGKLLRYEIGPRELQAIERFWRRARELELVPRSRALCLHGGPAFQMAR